MEREYLGNFLTFGKAMMFPEEELLYPQNFTVKLEFHCFLAVLRKPFENAHRPQTLFSL
jgi:hypothetical protein